MRYLAVDPGEKRTGLAIGDDETRIATPLAVIETPDRTARVRQVRQAIESHSPGALVVGLPLNMDGTEGAAARKARALAAELSHEFQLPVHLADERLSSRAADALMHESGLSRNAKRRRQDALAAATILQDFLNAL
jgi:putative Holliday junction resolvase